MSIYNLCFGAKVRKKGIPLQALYIKLWFKGVFISWTCFSDGILGLLTHSRFLATMPLRFAMICKIVVYHGIPLYHGDL